MVTTTQRKALKFGEEENWLALYQMGKNAWNFWASSEQRDPKLQVIQIPLQSPGYGSFREFVFPVHTSIQCNENTSVNLDFTDAVFHKSSSFHNIVASRTALFKGTRFLGNADFSFATFANSVHFQKALFAGKADFHGANFRARSHFENCTFQQEASFASAEFLAHTYFHELTVEDSVTFSESSFDRKPFFNGARFRASIPDFSQASFSANSTPDVEQMKVNYPKSMPLGWVFGISSQTDASQCARRLKKFAIEAHDHDSEMRFFAFELKGKRGRKYKYWNPLHWPALLYNHAYGFLSDYGQSIGRPAIGLCLTALVSSYYYAGLTAQAFDDRVASMIDLKTNVATATLLSLIPFAGQTVIGRTVVESSLCPIQETELWSRTACLSELYWISSIEGIAAFVFLFLLGLALRNRAKIN